MTSQEYENCRRAITRIDRQIAELIVKRAQLEDEITEARMNPVTGKSPGRRHVPAASQPVSQLDQQRAEAALQTLTERRRIRA